MNKVGSVQVLTIVWHGSPLDVTHSTKLSSFFDTLVTAGTHVKVNNVSATELVEKEPEVPKTYPGDESIRVIGETLNTQDLNEEIIMHLVNYAYKNDKLVNNAVKQLAKGIEFNIELARKYNLDSDRVMNAIYLLGK